MTKQLIALTTVLADARRALAQAQPQQVEALAALQELEAHKAYVALTERVKAAKAAEADAKLAVQKAAVRLFGGTAAKQLIPGVTIKEFATVEYNTDEAFEYALANMTGVLQLNKATFRKVALSLGNIPCVTISKEPRASITKDLSRYETSKEAACS